MSCDDMRDEGGRGMEGVARELFFAYSLQKEPMRICDDVDGRIDVREEWGGGGGEGEGMGKSAISLLQNYRTTPESIFEYT